MVKFIKFLPLVRAMKAREMLGIIQKVEPLDRKGLIAVILTLYAVANESGFEKKDFDELLNTVSKRKMREEGGVNNG